MIDLTLTRGGVETESPFISIDPFSVYLPAAIGGNPSVVQKYRPLDWRKIPWWVGSWGQGDGVPKVPGDFPEGLNLCHCKNKFRKDSASSYPVWNDKKQMIFTDILKKWWDHYMFTFLKKLYRSSFHCTYFTCKCLIVLMGIDFELIVFIFYFLYVYC